MAFYILIGRGKRSLRASCPLAILVRPYTSDLNLIRFEFPEPIKIKKPISRLMKIGFFYINWSGREVASGILPSRDTCTSLYYGFIKYIPVFNLCHLAQACLRQFKIVPDNFVNLIRFEFPELINIKKANFTFNENWLFLY